MAQRAGRALREQWADAAYAARPCPRCGHTMGWHATVATEPASATLVDGRIVLTEAVYGTIACRADGCGCQYPNKPGVAD